MVSRIPVHQDGTCNGLQHYAAMGRDLEGAKQVNLVNLERPGDIYTHVANLVEEKIIKHSNNPASPDFYIATKLSGKIRRKIVKQTVMTTVYGVTFIGMILIERCQGSNSEASQRIHRARK
jgi:DNA-directed RNA polymerase